MTITLEDLKNKKIKLEFGNQEIIDVIKLQEKRECLNIYRVKIEYDDEIIAETEDDAYNIASSNIDCGSGNYSCKFLRKYIVEESI